MLRDGARLQPDEYTHFTTSTKLPVLLGCLARAFDVLGVPPELLVDNMKQAVDTPDVTTGTVRWNATFLDFVEHYGGCRWRVRRTGRG